MDQEIEMSTVVRSVIVSAGGMADLHVAIYYTILSHRNGWKLTEMCIADASGICV